MISKASGLTGPCFLPVSNRVIMEVVPCDFPEEEEELSVWKVRLVPLCLR